MTPIVDLMLSTIRDILVETSKSDKVLTVLMDRVGWHKLLTELYRNPLFITSFQVPLPGEPLKIVHWDCTLLVYSSPEMAGGMIRIFDNSIIDIHHNL